MFTVPPFFGDDFASLLGCSDMQRGLHTDDISVAARRQGVVGAFSLFAHLVDSASTTFSASQSESTGVHPATSDAAGGAGVSQITGSGRTV